MKKRLALGLLLVASCGCEGMSHTDQGALAGGGLGAVTGAVVGGLARAPVAGAVLGGAAGMIGGALVGNAADRQEHREHVAAAVAAANARRLTLADVVNMTQQHIDDQLIINQIRTTGSYFDLTPSDVTWLKQNGVSDVVVAEMQAHRPGYAYEVPPGYVRPVYVVEDPPPPPVHVGVGVGWYGGRCWR
jgi:hypothetical protein